MEALRLGGKTLTPRRRRDLAFDAAKRAQRVRSEAGLKPQDPAPVFDIISELGIELRFIPIPSMEGVYKRQPSPVILVSSLRPAGRQALTGAHELGHHVYGHGVAVDEASESAGREPDASVHAEEYLADRFGGIVKCCVSTPITRRPSPRFLRPTLR